MPIVLILFLSTLRQWDQFRVVLCDLLVMATGQHLLLHIMGRRGGTVERVDRQLRPWGDALLPSARRDLTRSTFSLYISGSPRLPPPLTSSLLPTYASHISRVHTCALLVWATPALVRETKRIAITAARQEKWWGVATSMGIVALANASALKPRSWRGWKFPE